MQVINADFMSFRSIFDFEYNGCTKVYTAQFRWSRFGSMRVRYMESEMQEQQIYEDWYSR